MKNNILSALLFTLLAGTAAFADTESTTIVTNTVGGGIGIGTIIAILASWSRNKSVLWAIIHGLLGWIYVIYYLLTNSGNKKNR